MAGALIRALTTNVPCVWLYQLEKFVPVMLATSAERVTVAPAVGMNEVAYDPASICAHFTVPETVQVKDPAVGVKVLVVSASAPVPLIVPLDVPERVMLPVP
jgi:hypothetical protein